MAASIRKLVRVRFGPSHCHCWKINCRKITQTFSKLKNKPAVAAETEAPEKSSKTLKIQLDPWVSQGLQDNSLKHKEHPGLLVLRTTSVPERLAEAAAVLLEKYPVENISDSAGKLANYLWSRHPPPSDAYLTQLGQQIEEQIATQKKKKGNVQREKVLQKIRQKSYHWEPVKYDAYKCLLYLTARMASDYGVILQCLTEISSRLPDFVPRSIYNFGSGLGSVIWGANRIWGERVFEYYCVDKSQDMNCVARLLLQDGESQKQMHIPGVVFRQFPPSSIANKFSMVVSAYTLLEHASKEERLQTIESLWHMTEDFLVLVENGTGAGFSLINEARDHLLGMADTTNKEHLRGFVFAPCPHDLACPRMAGKNLPCFFKADFQQLKENNSAKASVRYSYIILRKGRRPPDEEWPRVVQEVITPSKHSHLHLCCADGTAHHLIITQCRHGKDLYRCTRYTSWGDRLPIKISEASEEEQHSAK